MVIELVAAYVALCVVLSFIGFGFKAIYNEGLLRAPFWIVATVLYGIFIQPWMLPAVIWDEFWYKRRNK